MQGAQRLGAESQRGREEEEGQQRRPEKNSRPTKTEIAASQMLPKVCREKENKPDAVSGKVKQRSLRGKERDASSKHYDSNLFKYFYLGILSEENEDTKLRRYMYPSVHVSITDNSQDVETT